jgi:iron complex outermembrane recepter protein
MRRQAWCIFLVLFFSITHTGYLLSQSTLRGVVADAGNSAVLAYTQLALLLPTDSSVVTGTMTGQNGSFTITTDATGSHLLRLSRVGYETWYMALVIKPGANSLGRIKLTPAATELGAFEVEASAMLFTSEADRRVYDVENMLTAEGGTALQLLETLPSVQLDEEGNISLRGSGNILIYINGRPTNLTADDTESILEQYPASAIKSVELITNPSSRYDAEGAGGIINIILKEGKAQGFNGQVNGSVSTGNKYTTGFHVNYLKNRWQLSAGYTWQHRENWEVNETSRQNLMAGFSPVIEQDYYTENIRQSHLARFTASYHFSEKSHLDSYISVNMRSRERDRLYTIHNLSLPGVTDSLYRRHLTEDQSQVNTDIGASWHLTRKKGEQLTLSAQYAMGSQNRIEYFTQRFYDSSLEEVIDKRELQEYERPLANRMWVFDADYRRNMPKDHRLEAGFKATIRHDDRSQNFGLFNPETTLYEEVILKGIPINNHFTIDRGVYAGYFTLRNQEKRLSYLAGLRGEYTHDNVWQMFGLRSGYLDDEDFIPARDTTHTTNHFGLFPSLHLSYQLSENQDLQASYSRRIRRPRSGHMMPFINAQDFYNLRLGNPYLKPAFTNNYEINYLRSWSLYMISVGVFHRNTENSITRLFVPYAQGTMVTWTNANTRNVTGVELIQYFYLNSNMDATLTGNYYHSEIRGELEGEPYSNSNYSWTLSLLGNYNFPGWFRLQSAFNYWGPRLVPQGEIKQMFTMNIGVRRNVFNNRGTISLNVSDLFNSRRFVLKTASSSVIQQRDFYRESRIATISFTWRFRNYSDRNDQQSPNGIDGDIDSLF